MTPAPMRVKRIAQLQQTAIRARCSLIVDGKMIRNAGELVGLWRFFGAFLRCSASQFSRYVLEGTGILARDENARLNTVKIIKYSSFRAFLARFREDNCEALFKAFLTGARRRH